MTYILGPCINEGKILIYNLHSSKVGPWRLETNEGAVGWVLNLGPSVLIDTIRVRDALTSVIKPLGHIEQMHLPQIQTTHYRQSNLDSSVVQSKAQYL
jgi:hypothetical protein